MTRTRPSVCALAALAYLLPVLSIPVPAVALSETQVETIASTQGESATPESLDSDGDGEPDRPDAAAAASAARTVDTRVEDLSQRSHSTRVFANPNGSWTSESSMAPTRAQDAETGEWAPIDTSLVREGGVWRPENAATDIAFSAGGGSPLVAMSDVRGEDLSWTWPSSLPAPTVVGDTLTYPGVLPEGDLVVKALADGFSHSVVLNSRPSGVVELPMIVDVGDAELRKTPEGGLEIADGKRSLVSAPAPKMWDSSAGSAQDETQAEVRALRATVTTTSDETRMTLRPDAEFLADPDTVYPVTLDPTFTINSNFVAVLEDPQIENDGMEGEILQVGHNLGSNHFGFMMFDSPQLQVSGISNATLSLNAQSSSSCNPVAIKVQRVTSAWSSGMAQWNDHPDVTNAGQSVAVQEAKGAGSCSPAGWDTWDITSIAQAWGSGANRYGVRISLNQSEIDEEYREYHRNGTITVTSNGDPGKPDAPLPDEYRWSNDVVHVPSSRPTWSTRAADPDLGTVRYEIEVHEEANGASPVVAACNTGYVSSGTQSSCRPATELANGTYFVRAAANDGTLIGEWSAWRQVVVNIDQPEPVGVTCTSVADQRWYDPRPAENTTCAFASPGASAVEWTLNGTSKTALVASATGTATTPSIAIPANGWTELRARGVSRAGRASEWKTFAFGAGAPVILNPSGAVTTAGVVNIHAVGLAGAASASLEFRNAGQATAWTPATAVTANGSPWAGSVVNGSHMSATPELTWTPSAESGVSIPSLLEARVQFSYNLPTGHVAIWYSNAKRVQVNAVDANLAGPSADLGPGSVDLASGGYMVSASDAALGTAGITRLHHSNPSIVDTNFNIFGDGWASSVAPTGAASYKLTDQRALSASFVFRDQSGNSLVFQSAEPASASVAGEFVPVGLAATLGATVNVDSAGKLTYTAQDGVVTTFELVYGRWVPTSTVGTGTESTTSYYYDSYGRPIWILAPPPPGIVCSPSAMVTGCQALNLVYGSLSNGGSAVSRIDYVAWDPKISDVDTGNDGLPDSDAGMTTTTVAKYEYDGSRLVAWWDPRLGDGAAALKTTYAYGNQSGGGVRITRITEPGLQPWNISYASNGSVTSVARDQDPSVGTGQATWTVRYGIPLNGTGVGLPSLTASSTSAWGQSAGDAPVAGAAVFNATRVPGTSPTAADWQHAHLYYWNEEGDLANSARYIGGDWQISSTRYDDWGNDIWHLSAGARNRTIAAPGTAADKAAVADRYASHKVYNESGDRVEATYGPVIDVRTNDGRVRQLRQLVQNVYDDEADPSLTPGRPTSGIPENGFDLIVEVRRSATDEQVPGEWVVSENSPGISGIELVDTTRVRNRYDLVAAGDTSGWSLRRPTKVLVESDTGWDTTAYRYDGSGRIIEKRSPQGVATDEAMRWTRNVHYTVDGGAARPECRNRAEWAGLLCWSGPAPAVNATVAGATTASYTGYSADLVNTREEQNSGNASRVGVAAYDSGGRLVHSQNSTAGSGASVEASIDRTFAFSAITGLPISVSDGSSTITTTYDTWGRVKTQSDAANGMTTATYNAGGALASLNDGKGIYTYGYDSSGSVTSLGSGVSGTTIMGAYDAEGNLVAQTIPGATSLVENWTHDLAGNLRSHRLVAGSEASSRTATQEVDVHGGVRVATEDARVISYSYDKRGRLVEALDAKSSDPLLGFDCTKRSYVLSPDSNRTTRSNSTYATCPNNGTTSASTTPTSTSNVTSTYDAFDRITDSGYVYDNLGRTTSLPATATSSPSGGPVSVSYFTNDMVKKIGQGSKEQEYVLDPQGRVSVVRNLTNGVSLSETTNHYMDGSDNPSWSETRKRTNSLSPWTATWTRYVRGIGGVVSIYQQSSGGSQVPFYNTHGDAYTEVALGGNIWGAAVAFDEFGRPMATGSTPRYGWHAQELRDSSGIGGLIMMGSRLYNPMSGRFLTRDPVPGGTENAYVHPTDPVNNSDISGTCVPVCVVVPAAIGIGELIGMLAAATATTALVVVLLETAASEISVPFPNPDAPSVGKFKKTLYLVYRIFYITPDHWQPTWKYGITRRRPLAFRPKRQISRCQKETKQRCDWEADSYIVGWFNARTREAKLIKTYVKNHGECPPGNKSKKVCT